MDLLSSSPVRLLGVLAMAAGLLVAACSASSDDDADQPTLPADQPTAGSTNAPVPTPTTPPVPTLTASPVMDSRTQVLGPPEIDSQDVSEEAMVALNVVRTGLKSDLDDLFESIDEAARSESPDKERENFFITGRLKVAIDEISRTLDVGIWSMKFDSADGKWIVTAKYEDLNFSEMWFVHDGTGTVEGPFIVEAP